MRCLPHIETKKGQHLDSWGHLDNPSSVILKSWGVEKLSFLYIHTSSQWQSRNCQNVLIASQLQLLGDDLSYKYFCWSRLNYEIPSLLLKWLLQLQTPLLRSQMLNFMCLHNLQHKPFTIKQWLLLSIYSINRNSV